MRNARVFISCGQRDERERSIGKAVEDYLKEMDFKTYFAERVHSSDALTENIFKFLRQSEYFVFIDFLRDKNRRTGSLFVSQEIAIATFLKLEGFGFLEKGMKQKGILNYQIYNADDFQQLRKDGDNVKEVIGEIIDKLKAKIAEWDINSVNELKIEYNYGSIGRNVGIAQIKKRSDWYHLDIRNRHKSKNALWCSGYVTKIKNLSADRQYQATTNELIWSGTGVITVNVIADTCRLLDAFYIIHDKDLIHFHQQAPTSTNPRYCLPDLPKGKYEIEYSVISSNFTTVSRKCILEYKGGTDVEFGLK